MRRRSLLQLFLIFLSGTSAFADAWEQCCKQGLIAEIRHDYPTALANFNAAVGMAPRDAYARYNRGLFYYRQHKYKLAISDLDATLSMQRTNLWAGAIRADACVKLGDYARAAKEYDHLSTIPQGPDLLVVTLSNRAWFEATCPDSRYRNGQWAVAHAKQALIYGGSYKANALSALAAAYAETGNFDSAIRYEQEAMSHQSERDPLPDPTGPMNAYRQRRPYRANP